MKRAILCLIVLLAAGAPFGQDEELRQAEKNWAAAVVKGDQAALERILAPDLIYAHSTGNIESKSEYLGKLKSGAQKYDAIDYQSTTVKTYGNAAVVHSKVRMRGTNKDGPFDHQLMMLHLWVKQGNSWQLAAHQTTRLP